MTKMRAVKRPPPIPPAWAANDRRYAIAIAYWAKRLGVSVTQFKHAMRVTQRQMERAR